MPTPALRSRKFLTLVLALIALTSVSAQLPDALVPGAKPPAHPGILPDLPSAPKPPDPAGQVGVLPLPGSGLPPLPAPPGGELVGNPIPLSINSLPAIPAQPAASKPLVKYVNKSVVEFEYEVTKKGRAGVKAVALWVRPVPVPGGLPIPMMAWQQVTSANPTDEVPAKLTWEIPADGSYGFRVQLIGNNDRKSVEFNTETAPEMVVIRDTVPPVVKDVRLDPPASGQKQAVIKWTATDANLGDKCVKLEYEQKAGGGWATIAEAELNSGSFAWPLDEKLPVSTRVRVTVTDLAGNATTATSETPTNLDPVVPEGRLTSVRGVELSVPSVTPTPPLPPGQGQPQLPPVPPVEPTPIPKARG